MEETWTEAEKDDSGAGGRGQIYVESLNRWEDQMEEFNTIMAD